jgi:hypothetical protein
VEYYSVMTRLPIPTKIERSIIYNLIEENIIPHVNVYHLTEKEYLHFLKLASSLQIKGGNIHDTYHYQVAHKMKADILLTWNTKDFLKFGGEIEIRTPRRRFNF